MSLLNKASLIQIPSGYKDGTLYSAKPTNGDGDFTFSRGSNLAATRVNSDGLIEKGRENVLLQSNQFDTTWTTTGLALTGGQSDKDGGTDAWLLQSNNTGQSFVRQVIALTGVKTYSVFAKAGTADFLIIYAVGGGDARTFFDLANGTTETRGFNITNKIEDVGNGWYRCSLIFDKTISDVRLFIADSDGVYNSGNGSSIYIQDAQLELGLVATNVIETGASTAQAGILEDMPRLDYSGGATCSSLLLEPQRTNLFEHSEYFGDWNVYRGSLTANDATSPEGINNAYRYEENSDSGQHFVRKTISMTSGTTYTASAFVKADEITSIKLGSSNTGNWNASATFNLSDGTLSSGTGTIEDYGNGWYRCIITAACTTTSSIGLEITTSSGAGSSGDGLYIYGAQIEAGNYVSSYIPTYGASVTRGVDIVDGAVDSNLFNDDEGVLFVEFAALADTRANDFRFLICDGTNNERIQIFLPTSNILNVDCIVSNSATANITYTLPNPSSNHKIAFKYKNNDFALWVDGVERGTDTSGATPSGLDRLDFYRTPNNNNYVEANVKQTIYFNTALTDDELATLTTL